MTFKLLTEEKNRNLKGPVMFAEFKTLADMVIYVNRYNNGRSDYIIIDVIKMEVDET